MLDIPRIWLEAHVLRVTGPCTTGTRRLAIGLAALIFTALLIFGIRCNDAVFEVPLHDSIDFITACPTQSASSQQQTESFRIPNIVHQIWKDENTSSYPINPSRHEWNASFTTQNYEVKLWTEQKILHLIKTSYPWLLSTYEGYPYNIQRADVARLAVVHAEGGIYADLDAYPVSTEKIQCIQRLGYQAVLAPTGQNAGISNHFIMGEKNSDFLLWALHEAKRRATPRSKHFPLPYVEVLWSTGPLMITSVAREYAWAYNYTNGGLSLGVLDEGYLEEVVHHAAGRSWHGPDGVALNYVADHAASGGRILLWTSLVLVLIGTAYVTLRQWVRRQVLGLV